MECIDEKEDHVDSLLCKVEGLEFQEAGDEVLVHDPTAGRIHVLNRSAATLLRLCDGSPAESLVDALMPDDTFDRARVQADVMNALEKFLELGLVQPRS
jgi:PqqD family protein of HPr-rel-A system